MLAEMAAWAAVSRGVPLWPGSRKALRYGENSANYKITNQIVAALGGVVTSAGRQCWSSNIIK
jgi:hypothetical protein